jgi:steroid 5-alpha reductase family enzyme
MTTLEISLAVLIGSIIFSFFYGLFTRNYSTVDRLWSVLPPLYVLIWMVEYKGNPRFVIAAFLVILWGARLTTNFALKGGYKFSFKKGFLEEDYRWPVLKEKIGNRVLFELFNLFFISIFQLGLIYTFTLPLYFYGQIEGPLMASEIYLYALFLFLLVLEMVADIQQMRFYTRRSRLPWSEMDRYKLGFNTFGLWKYSRHPNYVFEVGQWVVVYFMLVNRTGQWHYSGLGALVLAFLFVGSTLFAEDITSSKYTEYETWRKYTSRWIPVKSFFSFPDKKNFLVD